MIAVEGNGTGAAGSQVGHRRDPPGRSPATSAPAALLWFSDQLGQAHVVTPVGFGFPDTLPFNYQLTR